MKHFLAAAVLLTLTATAGSALAESMTVYDLGGGDYIYSGSAGSGTVFGLGGGDAIYSGSHGSGTITSFGGGVYRVDGDGLDALRQALQILVQPPGYRPSLR